MNINYENTEQISKRVEGKKFTLPKFGKSTTDPTYYEPTGTRIANMKKASGAKLEGIYDFYTKEDLSKFNSDNFEKNMCDANVDLRYNNKLLPEEVSQITNNLAADTEEMLESKKSEKTAKAKRINESLEINKVIESSQNNKTDE